MSLVSLHSWIAFFSDSDSAPHALPFVSSQEPASLSPQREVSPVCFSHPDQHPSGITSHLVSFKGSDDEPLNDSMSVAASDASDWMSSVVEPLTVFRADRRLCIDRHRAHNLNNLKPARSSVSAPEEPTCSHLDEWFLQGRLQVPLQRFATFFLEVRDELTKFWPCTPPKQRPRLLVNRWPVQWCWNAICGSI